MQLKSGVFLLVELCCICFKNRTKWLLELEVDGNLAGPGQHRIYNHNITYPSWFCALPHTYLCI